MIEQDSTEDTGIREIGTSSKATARRARERKVTAGCTLRVKGASWEDIARILGYPTERAAKVAIEAGLAKMFDTDSRDWLRKMAGSRLDMLLRATMPKALDEDNPEQHVYVSKAREVIADHRRLFGLDAPQEYIVTTPTTQEIDNWVARLAAKQVPDVEEDNIIDVDFTEEPPALEG